MIDAHHHFWSYDSQEYDWITPEMQVLRRDFLPADLRVEAESAGVDGVVSVQARQTVDETRWLLELAANEPLVRGVVGWAPLASDNAADELAPFTDDPKLVGVRHVVQGEPPGFLDGDAFNRGVALLDGLGLAYDLLVFERQLDEAIRFADRHPTTRLVLDHIAKPRIADGEIDAWAGRIGRLAQRENVWCKVSGMVTEADWTAWSPKSLQPYFDTVLEAFGPRRLMFGSDWPVCRVACDYARWAEVVREWAAPLSVEEREWLFDRAACEAYRIIPR
ncbi:Amidohydrolase [Pseudobythopirellula maris]|uniref:Amidohydrolase n=1 Tax=Pseudobythopirellula maris TaxID=2527991 RepID=A0A5C5ZV11_9BACT|nr:amidohydrolase family protein [Pseudobythopirellula maris]TWT91080.1 Amidohydrolase [Pseudobythopirellula maris]